MIFPIAARENLNRYTKSFINKYLISIRLPGMNYQYVLNRNTLLIVHAKKKIYSSSEFEVSRLSTNNVNKIDSKQHNNGSMISTVTLDLRQENIRKRAKGFLGQPHIKTVAT